jgi:protein TonB
VIASLRRTFHGMNLRALALSATFAAAALVSLTASAQTGAPNDPDASSDDVALKVVERVPTLVTCTGEDMPLGQCTQEGIVRHLLDNLTYPNRARRKGIQGKVLVQFVVERDGSVSNVEVLRSVHKSLDKRALKVVQTLPAFRPGEQGGKPVRVSYMIPVNFALD